MLGRGLLLLATVLAVLAAAGCAGPDTRPGPPIPTFADAPVGPASGPPRAAPGTLPADCAAMLSGDTLTALAAWPLGSTQVRTVYDVPAPASGRLARTTCVYTRVSVPGGPALPPDGVPAARVVAAAFTTPGAADAQAAANDAAETPVAPPVDVALGRATGYWYRESGDGLMALTYDRFTVELSVPDATAPPATALPFTTDLALRVLAALTPADPSSAASTPPPP